MARFNLKLLNLSDLKVAPAPKYPLYIFIKADDRRAADKLNADGSFANSILKKEKNSEQCN